MHGMIAPKENIKQLLIELENNFDLIISADLKKNGTKKIIHRELANHEAQITMDISDTVDALSDYKINKAQILAEFSEFMANCVKNDLFQAQLFSSNLFRVVANISQIGENDDIQTSTDKI